VPKYVLALDASQIKTYDGECNLMWAYLYRENLRLSGIKTDAMDKGTIVHYLLEQFYKILAHDPKISRVDAMNISIENFDRLIKEHPESSYGFDKEILDFLRRRFIQYVYFWAGRDLFPAINKENNEAGIELGFSKVLYEDENVLFLLEGRIDMIHVYSPGTDPKLCVVDHKTQDREMNHFEYRVQMMTYALAADVDYSMINYIGLQKEVTPKSFRRQTANIPKWMRERWRDYILDKVYWPIFSIDKHYPQPHHIEHLLNEESIEQKFKRNLSNCAGAFDTHPCMFTTLCYTENDELRALLKHQKYEVVEPWQPWKLKLEETL
jgi:hypothetical protein